MGEGGGLQGRGEDPGDVVETGGSGEKAKGSTGLQSTCRCLNTTPTMEHNIPSNQQNLRIVDRQLAGCHFHK